MELAFRPLARDDLPLLARWLGEPHVSRWWRETADLPAVEDAYGPLTDGSDPTEAFVAVLDGRPLGYIQRYRIEDEAEWQRSIRNAIGSDDGFSIDYLIGDESWTGRGYGRQMISEFVAASWSRYPDLDRVVVAMQQDNPASWRTLASCGFRRVWAGVLDSTDPSDAGDSYLYVQERPGA